MSKHRMDALPKALSSYRDRIDTASVKRVVSRDRAWWSLNFRPGWKYNRMHSIVDYALADVVQVVREAESCACLRCILAILGRESTTLIEASINNNDDRSVLEDAIEEAGRADMAAVVRQGDGLLWSWVR